MPDHLESLDDVYIYSQSEEQLPTLSIKPAKGGLLPLLGLTEASVREVAYDAASHSRLRTEWSMLVAAVRENSAPRSVLHSLILEDRQTIGSIAAALGRDVEDVEVSVAALQAEGWIDLVDDNGVRRVQLQVTGV